MIIQYKDAQLVCEHRGSYIFREYGGFTIHRDIHVYRTLEHAINAIDRRHGMATSDREVDILACVDYEYSPPQLVYLKPAERLREGDCILVGDNGRHYDGYFNAALQCVFCAIVSTVKVVGYIQ